MSTTAHSIRRLTPAELARHAQLGWSICTRNRCPDPHVYVVSHVSAAGERVRRRVCARHAELFAVRYGLILPVVSAAQNATSPALTATVASPRGLEFRVCPDCRHWLGRTDLTPGHCVASCRCGHRCHKQAVAA